MIDDLKEDLHDRLQAMILHIASLQEMIQQPGDWKEFLKTALTLEENAGAIRDLIETHSPQYEGLVKKYGENSDRFLSSDVISPAE